MQSVDAFGGAATSIPSGRSSVKERPVAATEPALLSIVKVRVLVPLAAISSGEKPFEKSG